MADKNKTWKLVEYILGLAAVASVFTFIYLNMSLELRDPDLWLHLKAGEQIVQQRSVPATDLFSFPVSGRPWIDHSWLTQVIFYLVFHSWGANNLILLSAFLVISAFLFLFFTFYKDRRNLILTIAIFFLAAFASRARFNIRPENFSILFFSLFLFFIIRHAQRKMIIPLLAAIQLFWVNCHGFYILGPALIGVFLLTERIKRAGFLPWEWNKSGLIDKDSYKNLLWAFWAVSLACFINPYGFKGVLYPLWVTSTSLAKPVIFYKYIQELLPTWRYYHVNSTYYVLILSSAAVFLLNIKKINFTYLVLWLIFLSISFTVNRNVIFFNLIAFLAIIENLIRRPGFKKPNLKDGFFERPLYFLKYAVCLLIIAWVIKIDSSILKSRYYIFEENRFKSSLLGIALKEYPEKAADFVLENDLPQNIFNCFNHGSYFIYRFYPHKKVFIDGRTELYGDDFFKNYQKILSGDKKAIAETINKYNINTMILSNGGHLSELGGYFSNNLEWVLVYLDTEAAIFIKNTPLNQTLLNRLQIDLKNWPVQRADLEKIGMKRVFPEPYIKRAWFFYYLGLNDQALSEAKEALRLLPSASEVYNIIGRIYLRQESYIGAKEALRLANIYSPQDKETLISLGDLYMRSGKWKQANKAYTILTKKYGYFAEGHYLLGQSFKDKKDGKSAARSLRKAVKLNPFNVKYRRALARAYYRIDDFESSVKAYEKAISLGLDMQDIQDILNDAPGAPGINKQK